MKKKKILKIVGGITSIVFLIIFLIVGSLWIYGFGVKPPEREITKIKGVWEQFTPFMLYSLIIDGQRLKEDGVNVVSFSPPLSDYDVEGHMGKFPEFLGKFLTKLTIQVAHKKDFDVYLALGTDVKLYPGMKSDKDRVKNTSSFLDELTPIVLNYVDLAQETGVKYFSPFTELDCVVGSEKAAEWYKEILPEIKKRYQGKLIIKNGLCFLEETTPDFNYQGYDYLALDMGFHARYSSFEDFENQVKENFDKVAEIANKNNMYGTMIGEYFVIVGEFGAIKEESLGFKIVVTQEDQAKAFEVFLKEAENANFSGYIACCWLNPIAKIKGHPAEKVMKEWYLTH